MQDPRSAAPDRLRQWTSHRGPAGDEATAEWVGRLKHLLPHGEAEACTLWSALSALFDLRVELAAMSDSVSMLLDEGKLPKALHSLAARLAASEEQCSSVYSHLNERQQLLMHASRGGSIDGSSERRRGVTGLD